MISRVPTDPSSRLVRIDVWGTAVFAVVVGAAIPLRDERPAQWAVAVVSIVLFAIGVASSLVAYTSALERSRVEEVGVANLFLLTGPTAPPGVKRTMSLLLGAQVAVGLTGAIVGASGLSEGQLNALAFGVLVPMFGIGMNGMWAARYGAFGPRVASSVQPTNRKID
jgi:hypothetical protein